MNKIFYPLQLCDIYQAGGYGEQSCNIMCIILLSQYTNKILQFVFFNNFSINSKQRAIYSSFRIAW